jgi:hypothetical protein
MSLSQKSMKLSTGSEKKGNLKVFTPLEMIKLNQ